MVLTRIRNVLKLAMITQLLCLPLALAAPSSLTFQGRIVKSDGVPLEHNNVSFLFQITDPIGSCVLYQEQVNGYDMSNSGGVFDAPIGLGSRSFPVAGVFSVLDSFNNSASLNCLGGSTYTPSLDDGRKLRVQFYDGSGWKLISPDNTIRSVPYAGYAASAARLGTNIASDFLLKAGLPTCGAGTFLSWNGTALSCAPVAGASGGTVTDVTSANGYITIINGTSTPQLTLQVGTAAGTVAAGDDTRFTNARVPSGSAGGDLSGSYPTPSVARMQGVAISAVAPTSGDFLKYNGTNWQGAAIAISDVTSLTTALNAKVNVSQFPASCAANQALTFSSPTGTFVCASIAIAGSQVTGNIAGNAAGFTGALVGDVSGTQGATSVDKIKGVPLSMTGNGAGKVLTFDGTNWAPADPATSGTVSSVSSSNLYLSVATGSTTPALTVNVGTSANTVAAGNDTRIVNAIQNAGNTVSFQSGLESALPAFGTAGRMYVATDTQKIYRDSGTAWVVMATAAGGGGTVTSVASGTGLTGGPITGTGTLAVDVGTTNGKILQLDGSARIPAVDGSLITNLSTGNLTGVVPVINGGTGLSTYTDGQILVGNSTGGTLAPQVLTGDAAMTNAGLVTVNRIKGTPVSATPTTTGQVLRYDGTSWTPNFVSMFDLHSSVTGNAAFGGGGCTSNQTLVWTAATDSLACTNISLPVAQITGTLPIASGGTGASSTSQAFVFAGPASGTGAPAFRAIASTDLPSSITNGLWTESGGNVYRSSGNVGIGTTTPSNRLVVGENSIGATGYPSNSVSVGNSSGNAGIHVGQSATARGGLAWIYDSTPASATLNLSTISSANNLVLQSNGGNVGVGTTPAASAILDVASTTKGFLPPRMTTAQRNAIGSPAEGLIVFDTTESKAYIYQSAAWSPVAASADVSFHVGKSGSQAIGALASVNWDTETYDTTNAFNLTTDRFQPTTPGKYLIIFSILAQGLNDTDYAGARIYKNGSQVSLTFDRSPFTTINVSSAAVAIISMNGTTDYLEFMVDGAGSLDFGTNGGTYAQGYLLNGTIASGGGGADNMGDHIATQNIRLVNTWLSGDGDSEGLRVDGSGNVGIGSTNPTARLHIQDPTDNRAIAFQSGTTSQNINFLHNDNGNVNARYANITAHLENGALGTNRGQLSFSVGPSGTGNPATVEAMRIDSGGRVGIASTAPNGRLTIGNNVSTGGPAGAYGSYQILLYDAGTANSSYGIGIEGATMWFNSYSAYKFYVGGSQVATIASNGVYSASDMRLKKNISPLDPALNKILNLDPVTYNWIDKSKGEQNEIGFIAQEVEKEFPQLINTNEKGFLSLNYAALVSPIVKAIKEFYAEYLDTKREVASLKENTHRLETENAELRAYLCTKDPNAAICH